MYYRFTKTKQDLFITKTNFMKHFIFSVALLVGLYSASAQTGNGLNFDGVNDRVVMTNDPLLQLNTGTIETWIKTGNAGTSYRAIICKQLAYGLFLFDNQLIAFDWVAAQNRNTGISIADAAWHHIAMTFSNGIVNGSKIYLDGNPVLTFTYSILAQTEALVLGQGHPIIITQNLNGTLDEVRIWNRILPQCEIQNNMSCELNPAGQTGLVAVYHLNEGVAAGDNTGTPPITSPGAPTITNVTAGNKQATVFFNPPASNGGSNITLYTATSSPGGISVSAAVSPIVVTGLTNGQSYTFTVKATNSIGQGPASAPSASVTPVGPPTSPTITSVTPGNGLLTVGFSPPSSNGGSPVTSYSVTANPGGSVTAGTQSPITVTGLTNGTPYTFTITATNLLGTSPPSAASSPATPVGVPSAPSITGVTRGNAAVTVAFSIPSSNGGSAILDYTVTSNPGGFTKTGASSPLTVTGLTNGQSYTFTVRARNANGLGTLSATSSSVIPATVPSVGVILSATGADQSASISFSLTTFNGGSPILNYVITASPGGLSQTATTSPFIFSGLTNGNHYTFTIRAVNALGSGPTSAASSPPTLVAAAVIDNAQWRIAVPNAQLLGRIDPMTGYVVNNDGSEYDPFSLSPTLPAHTPNLLVYVLDEAYVLTLDPNSLLLVTVKYTTINLDTHEERDFSGNIVSVLAPDALIYYVTTTGSVVDASNDQIQLNPGTLEILANGEPYTLQDTPVAFRPGYVAPAKQGGTSAPKTKKQ